MAEGCQTPCCQDLLLSFQDGRRSFPNQKARRSEIPSQTLPLELVGNEESLGKPISSSKGPTSLVCPAMWPEKALEYQRKDVEVC